MFVYNGRETYWLLLVMGVTNTTAMYMFIYVSQNSKTTTVALFRNLSVLFGFFTDVVIFKQSFTFLQCLGATIVLLANIAYVYFKMEDEKKKV